MAKASLPNSSNRCIVPECSSPTKTNRAGYCRKHATRIKKHGTTDAGRRTRGHCGQPDCEKPHHVHGFCTLHWERYRKYGSPEIVKKVNTGSLSARFWKLVNKHGPTQPHMETRCWEWTGAVCGGYGRLTFNYKVITAHRLSLYVHNGYWPKNALHRCDHKICVNPDHLYDGTAKENARDAVERGLLPKGDRVSTSKLSAAQVVEIKSRIARGERNKDIAPDYTVTVDAISLIRHGKNWKHIDPQQEFGEVEATPEANALAQEHGVDVKWTKGRFRPVR